VSHVPPGRGDAPNSPARAPAGARPASAWEPAGAGPAAEPVIAVNAMGGDYAPDESARQRLLPLPGVPRPGLAVLLPTHPKPTVLIDAGATADPKPEMLVQFGQLGVAYAQIALGIAAPKVGLRRDRERQ
jgi:hypothetical protein